MGGTQHSGYWLEIAFKRNQANNTHTRDTETETVRMKHVGANMADRVRLFGFVS